MAMENNDGIFSFDDEPLVLVDGEDHELGYCTKVEAHQGVAFALARGGIDQPRLVAPGHASAGR